MSQKPKTAYDVRRYMTLVQVIAKGDEQHLRDLAATWGVFVDDFATFQEMVRELAIHVVAGHYIADYMAGQGDPAADPPTFV